MEKNYLSLVVLLAIVGITVLAISFSAEKTGLALSHLCPEGMTSVYYPIPGGGMQVVCSTYEPVSPFFQKFDTYYANPRGDIRRQTIAQYGYAY